MALGPRLSMRPLATLDADLAAAADDAAPGTSGRLKLPVAELPVGAFDPALLLRGPQVDALLVVDGLLVREHALAGTVSAELIAPGELVGAGDAVLGTAATWSAAQPSAVAVLGPAVHPSLAAVPAVATALLQRAAQRDAAAALQRAITTLPRVEQRILALFAHLAVAWGRRTPEGILVPLVLTHRALGRLVGAARPTVSLALRDLHDRDQLQRRPDGAWLLDPAAAELLVGGPVDGWGAAPAVLEPVERTPVERPAAVDVDALFARLEHAREAHRMGVDRAREVQQQSRDVVGRVRRRRDEAVT